MQWRIVLPSLMLLSFNGGAHAYSGDGYEVCHLNPKGDIFLSLCTGPGSRYPVLMKLGPGSVVESRGGPEGNWPPAVVEGANGKTYLRKLPAGFVHMKYLCPF